MNDDGLTFTNFFLKIRLPPKPNIKPFGKFIPVLFLVTTVLIILKNSMNDGPLQENCFDWKKKMSSIAKCRNNSDPFELYTDGWYILVAVNMCKIIQTLIAFIDCLKLVISCTY